MTDKTDKPVAPVTEADKKAYLAAQKRRNIAIGLALTAFIALVFIVTIVRIRQGLGY